jgi:hypothetical protein
MVLRVCHKGIILGGLGLHNHYFMGDLYKIMGPLGGGGLHNHYFIGDLYKIMGPLGGGCLHKGIFGCRFIKKRGPLGGSRRSENSGATFAVVFVTSDNSCNIAIYIGTSGGCIGFGGSVRWCWVMNACFCYPISGGDDGIREESSIGSLVCIGA